MYIYGFAYNWHLQIAEMGELEPVNDFPLSATELSV